MYGRRYGETLEGLIAEVRALLSVLRVWISVEHNEDGTHRTISREQRWLTGPWVIGGPDAYPNGDPAYVRFPVPIPTGTYHNFDVPGLSTAVIVAISGTGGNLTFTGFRAPSERAHQLVLFRNEDASISVTLQHENAGSDPENRFRLPNNLPITLNPNESVWLMHDTKWQRWATAGMVR